jgi:hypothetical protein
MLGIRVITTTAAANLGNGFQSYALHPMPGISRQFLAAWQSRISLLYYPNQAIMEVLGPIVHGCHPAHYHSTVRVDIHPPFLAGIDYGRAKTVKLNCLK